MTVSDRRGIFPPRALLCVVAVFGVGVLVFGPLRSWARELLDANTTRGIELNRRVQAQRLGAVKPELAQVGIEVEEPAATADPVGARVAPVEVETGWLARTARWWRQFRGVPEPVVPAPLPTLPDSLGLRPGERMFFPNGRVIHYDSNTFRLKRYPSPTMGH